MEQLIDGIVHVTASDAAQTLKTTPLRILMLIKQQALTGCQIDGEWFVTGESVARAEKHAIDAPVVKGGHCTSSCSGCGGH